MAQARKRPSEGTSTPTTEVVGSVHQEGETTDRRGRHIVVRKIGPRKRMMIFAAMGAELSQNQQYWGTAMLACAVVQLDGESVPQPTSRREIEALVERLGDEGLEAAGKAVAEMMGVTFDEAGNPIFPNANADEVGIAKNS